MLEYRGGGGGGDVGVPGRRGGGDVGVPGRRRGGGMLEYLGGGRGGVKSIWEGGGGFWAGGGGGGTWAGGSILGENELQITSAFGVRVRMGFGVGVRGWGGF